MMIVINDANREFAHAPASKWLLAIEDSLIKITSYDIRANHTIQTAIALADEINITGTIAPYWASEGTLPVTEAAVFAIVKAMKAKARERDYTMLMDTEAVLSMMIMDNLLPPCEFPYWVNPRSNLYTLYSLLAFYAIDSINRYHSPTWTSF
jgi:hypothetical protein